ncbi:MAG: TolC family protein [Methylococcales bacterium]|nr:TolC family protein [Methylococcales bacterium]
MLPVSNVFAVTLQEVIQDVIVHHPDARSARALLNASDAQLKQSYSNFLPIADLTYKYSDSDDETSGRPTTREVRRLDGTLRWNVFNGLTDWYSMRSAQYSKVIAEADLAEMQNVISLRLTELYIDILRLNELLKLTENHLKQREKVVDNVKKRAKVGRISKADELQAVGRMIETEHDLSIIQGQIEGLKYSFKEITGIRATDLVEPDFDMDIINTPYQKLLQQAVTGNTKYLASLKLVDVRNAEIKSITGDLLPDVDLEYKKRFISDITPALVTDTEQTFSLQVNYQIPLGGLNVTRRMEAVERKYAAIASADSEILKVKTRLVEIRQRLKKAHLIKPKLKNHTKLLEDVSRAYSLQFNAGKRSLIEILIMLDEKYRAENAYIDNYYQIYVDTAKIYRELGQLYLYGAEK